jgi:hypothetical protein
VSLSAASCARAAHSAAFCRQYPIFSCMTVSALEPAVLSISPRLGAELGEGSTASTPEERIKFQCVGWAKRSEACPRVDRHAGEDTRGYGPRAPSARPCEIFHERGLRDGNRKRRRAFYTAGETSIEYAV